MGKNKFDFEAIREMHRNGNFDAAKSGYLEILRKNPKHVEAMHLLAILYAQQENFSEAIDYLQKAVAIQPHNLTLNLHLANMLKLQGLYSQAAQLLENLLKLHPNYAPGFNNLGTIYYAQAKFSEAISCYKKAMELEPEYIDAYYNLGLALNKKNDAEASIEIFTKLLQIAPEHFAARFHLACMQMQHENIKDAITAFLQIEETHPNHFETQTNLATCYLKLGALNEAKAHYFKALELMPEDIQILFNLGVINMQQGNIDIAIQHYQRASRINPDDFATHNNLGVAFLAKQHLGFALYHFQEALRIQPTNKALHHTLKILSEHQHLLESPPEYVKSLFDSYADHYEPHLLQVLDYKIPQLFLRTMLNVKQLKEESYDILDLGCGTGLCGTPFKPYAKTLIGVDLSPKMLAVAAQKNIYDELIENNLTEFLIEKESTYDIVLAGDVLVYIGELEDIFKKINAAMRVNGFFIFNAEVGEAEFKMNQSGRFVHSKKYLETIANKSHFKIIFYEKVPTRLQNNEPTEGHLFILQKA